MARIRYPAHFGKIERKMWRDILAEYAIEDSPGLKVLQAGLEAHQRAREARELINIDGLIVIDRFGQKKAHPLCVVERDNRAAFLSALKLLNLEFSNEGAS